MITQEELWALNVLTAVTTNAQAELERVVAARQAIIKLLEDKYNSTFDEQLGQFKPEQEI